MSIIADSHAHSQGERADAGFGEGDALVGRGGATGLYLNGGVLRSAALDRFPRLLHAISVRTSPKGDDWNLSARRGTPAHPPDPHTVERNRELLASVLGISLDKMVGCRQVHSTVVACVGPADAGKGMRPGVPSVEGADALVTATPGLYLLALSADCPPVFLYDPVAEVVGLAHSGWKGSVGRIAANTAEAMVDQFGSEARHIRAVVGPGIGPCCYSVGENVIEAAEQAFPGAWDRPTPLLHRRGETTYFNLWEAIRRALVEAGLPPENVMVEEVCTAGNLHLFYSHRAEKGACGLFGAVLGLRAR